VFSVALFFGCGDKAPAGETGTPAKAKAGKSAAVSAVAQNLLAAVPDDSPYVFANTAAMPKDFMDRIGKAMTPAMQMLEKQLLEEEKRIGDSTDADDKMGKAFIAELKGNLNRAGMAKMGFDPDFRFVMYGVGVLPVMRFALKDAKAFRAMIARIETNGGRKAPTAKHGDQEYYRFANDGMIIAMAVLDDQVVASLMPEASAAMVLPALFAPKGNGKVIGAKLEKNAKAYGLRASSSGYVDLAGIARSAMGTGTALNNQIFAAITKGQMPPLSAACKTDYEGLVKTFPGMAFGYTELSGTTAKARYVFEIESALAAELASLRSAVPGLGKKNEGLATFGMGLDVEKALTFLLAKANTHKPYGCENLSMINQVFGGMGMVQAVPPELRGLKGLIVNVTSMDMGANGPGNIKATALLLANNADNLITMAKGQVPPLASLAVKTDATPVAFPAGLIPPVAENPHVAMTKNAIAISVGKGEEAKLSGMLSAKAPAATPVFYAAYDMQAIMKMTGMGDMGMQGEEAAVMKGFMDLVKSVTYSIDFQKSGIVMEQSLVMP
jgi:hypothetical protein